jgi:hypothetical protein
MDPKYEGTATVKTRLLPGKSFTNVASIPINSIDGDIIVFEVDGSLVEEEGF